MVDPRHPEHSLGLGVVDVTTLRENRGWFIALGIGLMILGILAILLPPLASLVTTVVIGWLMVLGGIFQGVHAIQNRRWRGWGWTLVGAALLVVAGIMVVMNPVTGTLTLTL